MPRALVVDDDEAARSGLGEWLEREGFSSVRSAGTVEQARKYIDEETFDLVLLDLDLPDGNGIELFEVLESRPETEVIVVTGHGSLDSAVEAIRGGVADYLTKPVDLTRLEKVARRLRRTAAMRHEIASLRDELRRVGRFGSMIGSSPAMQQLYDLISRVAPTPSTVLVIGETGTGKELVAQTIHERSRRREGPFLPVNCGAVAPNLIESELFGHEKGSFTGAEKQRKGIFERAHGGTLFLDEVTEMPADLQVKLLRVLETGAFERVGGDQQVRTDTRVIAATNRDPKSAVRDGKLREDLLYRLNVFPIHVPPLRERGEDVELLANHFLAALNESAGTSRSFTPEAIRRLRSHPWQGNVRELRNVVERAVIIAASDEIDATAIPLEGGAPPPADGTTVRLDVGVSIAEAERRLILATLGRLGGDKKKAADVLGISLKTLYNRLSAYESAAGPTDSDAGPGA